MMNKLIITQGLPCSGKTTWAEEICRLKSDHVNINRDDIRLMLMGRGRYKKFTAWREDAITDATTNLALNLLGSGKSVIISDTNLAPAVVNTWKNTASHCNAQFEIKSFLDVPYGVCLERDQKRQHTAGQSAIMGMYNKYKHLYWEEEEVKDSKPYAYIFDMDGTLATLGTRSPYNPATCYDDEVNDPVAELLNLTSLAGNTIIIISGREDEHKEETMRWIKEKLGYEDDEYELYMRKKGDSRKDYIIKEEIYEESIKDRYTVLSAFDDRNRIVHMWRAKGIPTFQVNYGYF